jgi:type IV pilus assembly protein PilY1
MMTKHMVLLAMFTSSTAYAQSSLVCPQTTSPSDFTGTTLQNECTSTVTTGCTAKSGVSWDPTNSVLKLPTTAGSFQSPGSNTVEENVLFAAVADYDRDGWEDIAAANDYDKIFVLRNQTITCNTTTCTTTTAQTIASTWWDTLTNKRPALFKVPTNSGGTKLAQKAQATGSGSLALRTPMAAGDFNGDGWPDFIAVSHTGAFDGSTTRAKYATAARLYLNTQNCKNASNNPCGIGMTCTGQDTADGVNNGECIGTGLTSGTAFTETQLSCTSTTVCQRYHPTFATFDLRTGAETSANNAFYNDLDSVTEVATTSDPGDFGPMNRPTTQIQVLDWDGDGDLDFLYGHGVSGTDYCPAALCSANLEASKPFYSGIQVWLNNCAQSSQWNATAKSCIGHIPSFSNTNNASTAAACNNSGSSACTKADTLIPSTSHNSTSIAPNTNLGFDYSPHQVPVFSYTDIDNDNDRDLVIGSVGCCSSSTNASKRLRIFKNSSGSMYTHTLDTANPIILSTSSSTYPGFEGALTAMLVHDFSGDGYADIITAGDSLSYNSALGGLSRYWANTGNALTPFGTSWPTCSTTPASCTGCTATTCNPTRTTALSNNGAPASDFDFGLVINYDNDPSGTKDVILTDGAGGALDFYVFANRSSPATIGACGTAISGTLPTPDPESTVTGACITPTATINNTTSSIRYYMSNEDPANYLLACTQTSSGISPDPCCVSFPNVTGKTIVWKAVLDTNSSDDASSDPCSVAGTSSPTLTGVAATYTYNNADQHFRAGVVVSDGITYTGSFRQPGDRGHFYALAAGDGTKYYDAATYLDAGGARNLFTADATGANIGSIAFSPSSPSSTLISRVGASNGTEATNIINWVLSKRFGTTTTSRLGAVVNSTPAVLTPPFRPTFYSFLSSTDKAVYDTFASTHAARVTLALFGSMDGMLHAIITKATAITDAVNGREAWAFIPPYVAASMKADYTASLSGTLTVTAYPDGSPTLADYKKADGNIATVVLIGDGAGGSSLTALDITNTVNNTSYAVTAPDPLWSQKPGDADAGNATGKPAIARVKIGTTEKFIVVAGTGLDSSDTTKGHVVAGYELETGTLLWKFEATCPLTSDITVFETDDDTETGTPVLDGFIDRAVFADNCGYVYKINPAQDLSGGWMDNNGFGSITLTTLNGKQRRALFSTTQTGALGGSEQRPIVGTIGAKSDAATDMILFFGTGGLDAYDVSKTNEFYAVRAKDGTIRNKITGTCASGMCEKFYGGVVITTDSVIVQRNVDAVIGGGSCDFGSTKLQFLDLATFNQIDLVDEIGGSPIASSTGPLFGDANALYFATVSGEIKRIGSPRATTAGGDSASGNMNTSVSTSSYAQSPFSLVGWRVVL